MTSKDIDEFRMAALRLYHSQFSPEAIGEGLVEAISTGRPIWSSIFYAEAGGTADNHEPND
jgi:hypothetical protein